jgi:3'-phosphoadenosine 5'-phosphosulfate sulfotransferase (PAPS reductase)/FAD synthetase
MTERLFPDRPASEALAEAHDIVALAKAEHRPVVTGLLFSGGDDSMVLLDTCHQFADVIVHINTGIGIPEAHQFAREAASSYDPPFAEYHPPVDYETLCLTRWKGLPGPGMHNIVWQRLKERCIEQFWREHRPANGRQSRYLLLSGIRRAESKRRKNRPRSSVIERKGARVIAKPLFHWSNEEMWSYREEHDLPRSPVAAWLHMSGECLCGAMADQGPAREERALIRFAYPAFDAKLTAIEEKAKALGLPYTEWGVRRPTSPEDEDMEGTLCESCPNRLFALDRAEAQAAEW